MSLVDRVGILKSGIGVEVDGDKFESIKSELEDEDRICSPKSIKIKRFTFSIVK